MKTKRAESFWNRDIFGRTPKASPAMLAELCSQMSFMLESGVNLKNAMKVLADSFSGMQTALDDIMSGKSLSSALEETEQFPIFMCNMCRVGEISNNLPKVMKLLSDYYEEIARNRDEIKSALLYPTIVAVFMFALVVMSVLFVLPSYALMFQASEVPLPFLTQLLLDISNLMLTRWWLVLPCIVVITMIPPFFIRTKKGRLCYELILLHTPVYKRIINLQIVQAMDLILQSNQPLETAVLAVSSIIPNSRVEQDLQKVAAGLQSGKIFWTLIEAIPYIDPIVVNMSRVGDETGNMTQAFGYACEYNRHKFKQMTQRFNKLVEPLITLVLGVVLALVMLSVVMPSFAMIDLID